MQANTFQEIRLKGLALSKGRVVGKVCMVNENRHTNLPMYRVEGSGKEREIARVQRAKDIAGERIDRIREKVEKKIGVAESEIFVAQKMILEDPELFSQIVDQIRNESKNAESAIIFVMDAYEDRIASLNDEYMSSRATDISEIKQRLLDVLGNMQPSLQCDKAHCQQGRNRIVVAEELTPGLTIEIDPEMTLGFVTERGGINSHAAILSRSLGIPAISGLEGIRSKVGCGTDILLNGDTGEVVIWPSDRTVSATVCPEPLTRGMPEPVDPVDGLEVMANINRLSDIRDCVEMKAEGIGLYRTEFEIMAAERFFSEDELYERYTAVAQAMAGNMVVFRLFDIGSDKTMPFMELPAEENPSLGWRGTRLLLGERGILEPQARALARTSEGGRIHVMYPMIVDVNQFLEVRNVFMEMVGDIPHGIIQHGIMFEVPSACLQAAELFEHVDFASIGSNDLVQYLFAVDRDNELVSYDYNHDRPVLWKLLSDIAEAARAAGKPLSICGELAGYPEYVPKLVEAGIRSISVSPRRIPEARKAAAMVLE